MIILKKIFFKSIQFILVWMRHNHKSEIDILDNVSIKALGM